MADIATASELNTRIISAEIKLDQVRVNDPRIEFGQLNSGADHPGASGLEDGVERGGEAGVPVMQDELQAHPCILQVHQQVPGLLHYPRLDRMLRGSEDPDAAGTVLDDGQDVDLRAVEKIGGKEVRA